MASLLDQLDLAARAVGDLTAIAKQTPGPHKLTGQVSDPYGVLPRHATQLLVNAALHYGTIADGIPYVQIYRVLPETGRELQTCTTLRAGCTTPIGVADISTYTPGTRVLFAKHPDSRYGWILGAVPAHAIDPRAGRSYSIGSASCCGLRCEPDYQTPFRINADSEGNIGVDLFDFANRTPTDSLLDGTKGWVTETGLMISLDSYAAQMRVDAMTGLFLFYWDRLCRVAGHNYQLWTAGSVLESFDDEGEHYWQHGVATYLWEQMGYLLGPTNFLEEHSAQEVQHEKPWLARIEPKELDAQPFVRVQEYGGFIGQGHRRYVAVPPPGVDWFKQNDPVNIPGLAEQAVTLGGQILQRTATGLVLAKYPVIPVPKRMRGHTDEDGDHHENYRPAGHEELGSGPEHKVGAMPTVSGRNVGSVKAGGLLDLHAYLFNWAGVNAFHYHEKDYHLPDEEDCDWIPANNHTPQYRDLKSSHALPEPPHTKVRIDHRNGEVKIYHTTSSITLLDDGGVVVNDGAGTEINMTGGNLRLTAAGDISLEAGRNIVLAGGRDVIVKAKQSVDVSATDNDVRIKSQNNTQIVAGVGGGAYGVLIESQGTGMAFDPKQGQAAQHGGVILASPQAGIMGVGASVYLRTGGPGITAGPIVLDAAQGQAQIITNSQAFTRFVTSVCADMFHTNGVVRAANLWARQGAWVNGTIAAGGGLIATGGIYCTGVCWVDGVHVGDSQMVAPPDDEARQRLNQVMEKTRNTLNTELPNTGTETYRGALVGGFYADKRPGNDAVLNGLHFSFRTDDDYGTKDWYMYEPRWAQMARHAEQEPDVWEEKPVEWQRRDTYPYPGTQALLGMTYYQVDGGLRDSDTGRAVARGQAYEDAELTDKQHSKPLIDSYPIIG